MNRRHVLSITSVLALTLMYGCGKETPPPAPKAEAPKPAEVMTVKIGSASPLTGPQAHIGIDIRNGVQLECVNCAACADACDSVMTRLNRKTGLIRLTSHEAVSGGSLHWLTPRIKAYGAVWLVLVAAVGVLMARRPDLDVLILRQAGSLFGAEASGEIVNLYTVQVFNRAGVTREYAITVRSPEGATVTLLGGLDHVAPHALQEGRALVSIPREQLTGAITPVEFAFTPLGGKAESIRSTLVGPGSARGGQR